MQFWSPAADRLIEWTPTTGWNASFSPAERVQCVTWYLHFLNNKGHAKEIAERMALVEVFKRKYRGLSFTRK